MNENIRICCAIVTFNRKECLVKLLDGLCKQTMKIKNISILDNCSTDGTKFLLMEKGIIEKSQSENNEEKHYQGTFNDIKIDYFVNDSNTGGAGGFSKLLNIVSRKDFDYIWIMDDDVFPEPDCP